MNQANSLSSAQGRTPNAVGELLRQWRETRRMSQLDLSLETGVSTRHLSYVETGRSRPSRDLIELVAEALSVPLPERNTLLLSAGFAPSYRESALSGPELETVRRAIEFILAQHEPYPAFVANRYWDVLMANEGLDRLIGLLLGGPPRHSNILHQVFDPRDMRPHLANWEEVAGDLVRHLHQQLASAPGDTRLRTLLDEVLAYPELPPNWRQRQLGTAPMPVVTTIFRLGQQKLRFFSTLTTFAAPLDVTLEEMRIECLFPMDEDTSLFCRRLASLSEMG